MDVKGLLRFLSIKLLNPIFTVPIAVAFEDLLLLIITSSLSTDNDYDDDKLTVLPERFAEYQQKCVALAKLMDLSTDVKR